jgi:hypothetical protein
MELEAFIPYIVQAVGGAVGANILGALTRGGGGLVGRTLIGALAGLGAGYGVAEVPQLGAVAENWRGLIEPPNGEHLYNFITGAAGGGIVGLVTGLLIRQRD